MTPAELDLLWDQVKDLEPLSFADLQHYTRVSFRDTPAQPRGWVREYVPRIVRTLLGELRGGKLMKETQPMGEAEAAAICMRASDAPGAFSARERRLIATIDLLRDVRLALELRIVALELRATSPAEVRPHFPHLEDVWHGGGNCNECGEEWPCKQAFRLVITGSFELEE